VFSPASLLIHWQSRTRLLWNETPETRVTLRNLCFCQATFPAPSDLLGYILGCVLRAPLVMLTKASLLESPLILKREQEVKMSTVLQMTSQN
jgi:hypothetical protein